MVVETLKTKGVRAVALQSDQADTAAAKSLVDNVTAHFGKLVSAVACFLAGPSGGYMTGGVIDVSGGLGI